MAGISSRPYRRVCSLCHATCEPAHVVVLVRQASGVWRRLYRTCWDCGFQELRHLHQVAPDAIDIFRYEYVEVEA
jgi:hypothetical protein